MSADLFAEFSNLASRSSKPQRQQQHFAHEPFTASASPSPATSSNIASTRVCPSKQSSVDIWGDLSTFGAGSRPAQEPEEDWGDFESATPFAPDAAVSAGPSPQGLALAKDEQSTRTRVVRASTIDMMNNRLVDLGFESLQRIPGPSWVKPEQEKPTPAREPETVMRIPKPIRKSTEEFFDHLPASIVSPGLTAEPKLSTKPADPNVLFDADDFELSSEPKDDDDFGEFEGAPAAVVPLVSPQTKPPQSDPFRDLLGLDLGSTMPAATPPPSATTGSSKRTGPPSQRKPSVGGLSHIAGGLFLISPHPQASKSPSFQDRNPYPGLGLSTDPPKKPGGRTLEPRKEDSPLTAWPAFWQTTEEKNGASDVGKTEPRVQDDDGFGDWDTFDNLPPTIPGHIMSNSTSKHKRRKSLPKATPAQAPGSSWDWDPQLEQQGATERALPSIPIPEHGIASPTDSPGPPPANIPPPSVLLPIIPPLLRLPLEILLKPSARLTGAAKTALLTHPKTISFLRAHIALATVTAHILAGRRKRWSRDRMLASKMTVSAAGSKGMKLYSIDKTESQRESREAAEVIYAWKQVVGHLRTACASTGAGLKVPEIADTMTITTVNGGPTAPKACLICGLRREERVAKVDVDVEDSFGEWWVDHWGHRNCRNFWVKQEKDLRSR